MKQGKIFVKVEVDTEDLIKSLKEAKKEIQSLDRISFLDSDLIHCLMFLTLGICLGFSLSLIL